MTAARVDLGRYLFYDRILSANGRYACASCHRQDLAFTDGRARAVGSTGALHPRSAMSLANVAYNATLNWSNPSLTLLEDQARVPLFNREPVELGLEEGGEILLERLRGVAAYRRRFDAAFPGEPDPIRIDNVTRSIASFERTLISGDSPYDRLVYRDEREALSAAARRGMRLFFSDRIRCSQCHAGFALSGPIVYAEVGLVAGAFHNTGLYNLAPDGAYPTDNRGLFAFTGVPDHMGRFRAPTLRNIELTAPYMHDGSITTLEGVIDHYAAGGRTIRTGRFAGIGRANRHKSRLVSGFTLSGGGKADLVAFLRSLTDRQFVIDPRFSDPFGSADLP
jgi:cytochrome c peroxidase